MSGLLWVAALAVVFAVIVVYPALIAAGRDDDVLVVQEPRGDRGEEQP